LAGGHSILHWSGPSVRGNFSGIAINNATTAKDPRPRRNCIIKGWRSLESFKRGSLLDILYVFPNCSREIN
jgi:hypothetical protein